MWVCMLCVCVWPNVKKRDILTLDASWLIRPDCILCKYQLHRQSQCLSCILIALSWLNSKKNRNTKLQWHEYHLNHYKLKLISEREKYERERERWMEIEWKRMNVRESSVSDGAFVYLFNGWIFHAKFSGTYFSIELRFHHVKWRVTFNRTNKWEKQHGLHNEKKQPNEMDNVSFEWYAIYYMLCALYYVWYCNLVTTKVCIK